MSIAFSSQHACTTIAKREIRNRSRDFSAALHKVIELVRPLARDVMFRGKINRDAVRRTAQAIVEKVRAQENIVDVKIHSLAPSKLSASQAYDITFVQATAQQDNDKQLYFIATRVSVTRKCIEIFINELRFSVIEHVLTRYMQSERRPLKTFYNDILRPMRMAYTVGLRSMKHDIPDMALPFANGVLLGEVEITPCRDGHRAMIFRSDEEGSFYPYISDELGPAFGHLVNFNVMTYVEEGRLYRNMEALRNKLVSYEEKHRPALEDLFELYAFDREARLHAPDIRAATDDAITLVDSAEWTHYIESRKLAS